jgi:tetratricopeptide (TPR) repeat protein
LRKQPAMVAAHVGLGHALAFLGQNEKAFDCYERALAMRPKLPEAEFAAGFVLARLGRTKEAERRYRRALTLRPDFAAAWLNLGNLLREQGSEAYAEAALQRAVELRPDMIAGWINLALFGAGAGQTSRSRGASAQGIRAESFAGGDSGGLVSVSRSGKGPCRRWGWLRWALSLDSSNAEAVNMQGILLHTEGQFEEAVEAFERAEALGSHAATSNRGNSLLDLGRIDDSMRAHQAAVERDPSSAGALYNLSLTRLRMGGWQRGWTEYESRWRFREVHRGPRTFSSRGGKVSAWRAREYYSTQSKDWEIPSNSAAMQPWWRRAEECPFCRCRLRSSG